MSQDTVEFVVEGGHPPGYLQGLRELWAFREVVWAFAERNIRMKYKQAALGVAWAVIQPLAFLAVFVTVFGRIGGLSKVGGSYPVFALSALVPWFFLQSAVSLGAQALLMDGAILKKVYFAREAPVLGAVMAAGLDFAIGLGLLALLYPFLGVQWSWTMILAVPLWVALMVLASGVAMLFGALTVYYRDFRYALPLLLQLWMFASPVAYPLTSVPERWRTLYIVANPAAGILDGFRRTLADGRTPDLHLLAVSLTMTLIVAWAGYRAFKRLEAGFADAV